MIKQRILVLDIETRPYLVYTFELKDITIPLSAIKEEWCVIAWSAKWFNEPVNTIKYMDLRNSKDLTDDLSILKPIHTMMQKADIIVTQNGKDFDSRKLNARFDINGLKPLTHYRHYDLYLLSRKVAAYTSQKLEYVTDKLNTKYKKLSHSKFPGINLWIECLNGNVSAWNEMKKYNINDTLSTEERCNLVKSWAPKAFPDLDAEKCINCGKVRKIRTKCPDCNSWSTK